MKLAHKVESGVKGLLLPNILFEDLGLRYYGPIDGHDIPTADSHLRVSQDAE
ncbi:MAG: 1-deoxy-D-xylulose-5-phosphate synthase N-terminal domain-containing protein [Chthoniobacteraceae bacterium]